MNVEAKILNYLRKHPEGIMILDLADAIGMHRHTVTKYVYRLEGAGKIKIRKVGIAKLCYLAPE
jgi:DNA-binding Lrp family transcriptional regulator